VNVPDRLRPYVAVAIRGLVRQMRRDGVEPPADLLDLCELPAPDPLSRRREQTRRRVQRYRDRQKAKASA
jgi:hypothetical protein